MKAMKYVLTVIACMIGIIVLRLSFDQWQGYSKAMESLHAGDRKSAVMYLDRVLNAHIPFSPIEGKAKTHLLRLASDFEGEKEYEVALLCYETVRTSRYLVRHFWVPDKVEIPFLNDKVASIKAQLLVKDGIVKNFKEGYEQQMGIMNKDYSPSVFWSLITVAALLSYIGFIVLWIFKRKKIYIAAFSLCFVVWVISLYIA